MYLNIISFWFLMLFSQKDEITISGKVIISDDEGIPGAEIRIKDTDIVTYTNIDGDFKILVPITKKEPVLLISSSGFVSIQFTNLLLDNSKSIDIGNVSLFFNKGISILDYNSLSLEKRKDYVAIYHWAQLWEYMAKNQINEEEIAFRCKRDSTQFYKADYDAYSNKVVINYQKFKDCTSQP